MVIAALAALAGSSLVAAAMTDAWQSAREQFARLLGRGDADRTRLAEKRLDQARAELAAVASSDLDRVRTIQVAAWTTRLADLLEEHPDAEADLRALVDEIQSALPSVAVSAVDHSIAAGGTVGISASGGGFSVGVLHGNVELPGPTQPGQAAT